MQHMDRLSIMLIIFCNVCSFPYFNFVADPETKAFWYFVFNWKLNLNLIQPYQSRPKPIYKGDVECRFLEFGVEMTKWPWGSRSMTPIFNASRENPKRHIKFKFGALVLKIHYKLSRGQAECQKFWLKKAKMTLKVKVNDPRFQH